MNKYHSKKVKVGGMTFDSKKEYERYCNLLFLEKSGLIDNLRRQVKYELVKANRRTDGSLERPLNYFADFVYEMDGITVVEDVKGYRKGGAYELYKAKRKIMLDKYGIEILET